MSKRKQARGPEWFTEKIHSTKVDAEKKIAEVTRDAQRLDDRRQAQIRLQIDSINRLLDDPSAADEIVRVTENAAANRYLVDALLDRVNAYHSSQISAERFFVMIGEAIENRNRMVVGDEPTPPANEHPAHALAREIGYAPANVEVRDLSGAEQERIFESGLGWGNPATPRSKQHYYDKPGKDAVSVCGRGKAPDRSRRLNEAVKGDRNLCSSCDERVGPPRIIS